MRTAIALSTAVLLTGCAAVQEAPAVPRLFTVWATSCAHVSTDARRGRASIETAIAQSEGRSGAAPGFDWDVWLDAGDLSGSNFAPADREGREIVRQYQTMQFHRREQIYNIQGNHDASYVDDGPGAWFRKWGDPFGENTRHSGVDSSRRPFPVEGSWERYAVTAGNVRFLMLSDRNGVPQPVGRGVRGRRAIGGYPAGAVTRETFEWWKREVSEHQDKILVTVTHHALRDTTTASGRGEGKGYHHGERAGEFGSYLYYVIENEAADAFEFTPDAHVFEDYLAEFEERNGRGAIDLWIAGHTHVRGPEDTTGGKSITERRWGVHFLQVGALTRHHGTPSPISRVLTFSDGRAEVTARVYLHEPYRAHDVGFFEPSTVRLGLRHEFRAPEPIRSLPPFPDVTHRYRSPNVAPNPRLLPFRHVDLRAPSVDGWDPAEGGRPNLVGALARLGDDPPDDLPRVIADELGEHLDFDGSQRVAVGALDTESWRGLTLGIWFRNTTKAESNMRLVAKTRVIDDGVFDLSNYGDRWIWRVWDEAAEQWRSASFDAPRGSPRWEHVVGVIDTERDRIRIFHDGAWKADAPFTSDHVGDRGTAMLTLGAASDEKVLCEPFQGQVGELRVWPASLSEDRIRQVHAQGRR